MYTKKGLTLFTLLSLLLLSTTATAQLETTEQENSTGFPSGLINEISSLLTRDSGNLITGQFAGGDGSSSNPYQISTCQELQNMQNDLDASYELVNDVDCSGFTGFSSIGKLTTSQSNPFLGSLYGQGYVVKNLTINGGSGLFGYVNGINQKITNIGLVNVNVSSPGSTSVGGLVGRVGGVPISNSYVTGSVSGNNKVGGLVGFSFSTNINGSYSNVSVSGSDQVGGLVGTFEEISSISNSYSAGSVSGDRKVGGLVGHIKNDADVFGIYSTASVSGDSSVGGLVGYVENADKFSGSYSTGSVSGSSDVGGLIGRRKIGLIFDSYWDTVSSGQPEPTFDALGTGLSTSEMQGGIPLCDGKMSGLDFRNTWFTRSGDYPGLRTFETEPSNLNCLPDASFSFTPSDPEAGESVTFNASGSSDVNNDPLSYSWSGDVSGSGSNISRSFSTSGSKSITLTVNDGNGGSDTVTKDISVNNAFEGGDGSSGNPYQIGTCTALQDMQSDLSASYVLVNNVDCSGFSGFSSIGDIFPQFTGVLDGKGYVVENLTINEGSSEYVGLIGFLGAGGNVKNIGLVKANINGNSKVGGLVGFNFGGSVSGSYSTGSVSGSSDVGGLVGRINNDGNVSDSYSNASVSGSSKVGGLVGTHKGSISGSYSTGSVSGSGNSEVGGLVGVSSSSSISGSYSNASVSASSSNQVGGLVGVTKGSDISGSYSAGSVSGDSKVGGLIGRIDDDGNVSDSYSNASVSGSSKVGGLVGSHEFGLISGSYSTGSVSGSSDVGGLIGSLVGSVSNSYWDKESSGTSKSAGGQPLSTSEMQGGIPLCDGKMSGLDFRNTWFTRSGDYPGLRTFETEPSNLNCLPDASFSFTPSDPEAGESVTFNASGSNDPDGDSLSYSWSGDVSGSGSIISRSFIPSGSKSITLTVSDSKGESDSITKSVPIKGPPNASFSFTPSNPSIGEPLIFKASSSSDQDGSISSYEWDWDDDGNYEDTGEIATHSFSAPGDYNVELNVTDNQSLTNTSSRTVTVSDDTNPSINNPSPIGTVNTNSPTISADFSDNYDLNSYILELDGSQVASGSISGASDSFSYSASGLSFGQHSYNFSIEDSSGNRISRQETFTVSLLNSKPNPNTVEGALWVQSSDLRWGNGTYEFWLKDVSVSNTDISGPSGAIWIQGTQVHWIDQNSDERAYKGRLVQGGASSPKGALWFQNGFIHYIDENGDERVADGT
jgi:PKD repeat protein